MPPSRSRRCKTLSDLVEGILEEAQRLRDERAGRMRGAPHSTHPPGTGHVGHTAPVGASETGSGDGICTHDFRVMSPTSCCSTPRESETMTPTLDTGRKPDERGGEQDAPAATGGECAATGATPLKGVSGGGRKAG